MRSVFIKNKQMSKVSDEDVSRIYEAFKEYAERELRTNDNPNLAPRAFNEMPEPSLSHIIIPLTGVNRVDYREMDRALRDFPEGGASLHQEEGVDGKPEYWVYIPIPIPRKKRHSKKHGHSPRSKHATPRPSCTWMLLYVIGFLAVGMVATLFTTRADWSL